MEYIVVTSYFDDWSLYQIGLTKEQLEDITGLRGSELAQFWHAVPRYVREATLVTLLKTYAHQDISHCRVLEQEDK